MMAGAHMLTGAIAANELLHPFVEWPNLEIGLTGLGDILTVIVAV